jgi:hypothetical protein
VRVGAQDAAVRVIKQRDGGIVRRVELVDGDGEPVGSACRFLNHLADRGFSPHTLCAYAYDLKYLFTSFFRKTWTDEGSVRLMRCGCWAFCVRWEDTAARPQPGSRVATYGDAGGLGQRGGVAARVSR